MRRFYFGENCPRRTARSKGFSITRLPYQRTAPKNCPPKSYPPTSLFCFIYKRGYLDKNFIQKIQTSSFLQKVRIVFRRSYFYKKERPMALMLMAPAQILRQQKICGKTCGAKGVPPKPLKGSHTSASLVRCQRHRASELRAAAIARTDSRHHPSAISDSFGGCGSPLPSTTRKGTVYRVPFLVVEMFPPNPNLIPC